MSITALLLGGFIKVYDDVEDMKLIDYPVVHSSLQSIIVLLFTLTSYHDFYFSFACFILCLFQIGFDHPFWKSLIVITFAMLIFNIQQYGDNVILKLIATTCAIVLFAFIAKIEERLFPEEYSKEKIVFRMILLLGLLVSVWLTYTYDILPTFSIQPIYKTQAILIAYLFVSICIMIYQLYKPQLSSLLTDTGPTTGFAALMGRLRAGVGIP